MTLRRPAPAQASSPLPSLTNVAAPNSPSVRAGVLLAGLAGMGTALAVAPVQVAPYAPSCGPGRGNEIEAHGAGVVRHLERMDVKDALREMAVAFGLLPHPSRTTVHQGMDVDGGLGSVTPEPRDPVVATPRIMGGGAAVVAGPAPVPPPTSGPVQTVRRPVQPTGRTTPRHRPGGAF